MTQNQIAYFNAQELKRHNAASEIENQRHNVVTEAYEKWKNELTAIRDKEVMRSNIANEQLKREQNAINAQSIAETERHNAAVENLTALSTASQNALNSALSEQAGANATASYAAAQLSKSKINTEKSVQMLNRSNAEYTLTQAINYPYQTGYVISQTDLNKAKIIESQTNVQQTRVRTVHEGVNTLWDSIQGALNLLQNLRK